MAKEIQMKKVVIDGSAGIEEYKESILELFDYDEEECNTSVNKNYSFGIGIDIESIVKDVLNKDWIESYTFELHDLGDKQTLLIIAWIDK